MMAAPQMGLAPRRGRSHERSFSAAPATSSSKRHAKIWVFHCQLLLLTSTVWSRIAACETTMKTMALKHPGKKDCGCSGVLVACCSLVLWFCFVFFLGGKEMCESYFQVRSLHSFSESLPLQKSSPLSHLILSHCDGIISKPKSIHSYSFTPRSVPAVPKRL